MRGNALARARLPRGSPTRLRQIFVSGTCLSNMCFMFVFSDVFGTRALFIFFVHVFYVCFAYIDSYEISLFF